jgi:hypothetical protein
MANEDGSKGPYRRTLRDDVCAYLNQRCGDPHVRWPYHPRSGLGPPLISCLIRSLEATSDDLSHAMADGLLTFKGPIQVGSKRRHRKVDLVATLHRPEARLVAVEAKVCMTEHRKAKGRLVAELTSSLDAVLEADRSAKFFAIVLVNFADKFTSPTNLPGPNEHKQDAAPILVAELIRDLSTSPEINLLIVPVLFDNETSCRPTTDPVYSTKEASFISDVLRALNVSSRLKRPR